MGGMTSSSTQAPLGEIGAAGTSIWYNLIRQDYNPEVRGRLGLMMYDKMRRNDAQVRMMLRLMKTPVLSARWFIQPASPSAQDKKIADFVWDNLVKHMTISWTQVLLESLLELDFGYYMFEKVFDFHPSGNGKVIWKKLAPRHPLDVIEWKYDNNGGPKEAWMYTPSNAMGVPIPISKMLVFTFDKEAGNMEGISILRSAYKHWYFKENLYKIDAIQKERHGIGVPIIHLPPNFTEADRKLANDMGRNLRTNEKAHIVLPPNWQVEFAHILGQPVDAIASIDHHDLMMARNILAQWVNDSAASPEHQTMFLKATRFAAEGIRDVFNKFAIPELVDYNWKTVTDYPELRVRRIGDAIDWRAVSFAIRNFIGAGVIVPDAALEDWVRDEMDMPGIDPDTARVYALPQVPSGQIPGLTPQPSVPSQPNGQKLTPGQGLVGGANAPGLPHVGLPRQGPPSAKGASTGTGDRSGG
jgi:hypothetical protein